MTLKPGQQLQPAPPTQSSEPPDQPVLPGLPLDSGQLQASRVIIGPLPAPEVLAGYGYIDESFPNRIVTMAEENARTGRRTAERAQTFTLVERIAARAFGFAFACSAIGGAIYLALQGHDAVAGIIGGTTVAGVVAALIKGKSP